MAAPDPSRSEKSPTTSTRGKDPTITNTANTHDKSPAPANLLDFKLANEEPTAINALDKDVRGRPDPDPVNLEADQRDIPGGPTDAKRRPQPRYCSDAQPETAAATNAEFSGRHVSVAEVLLLRLAGALMQKPLDRGCVGDRSLRLRRRCETSSPPNHFRDRRRMSTTGRRS